MDFCPFHKEKCEPEKMVHIIQLKKSKIQEVVVCQDCIFKHFNFEINLPDSLPEEIDNVISFFLDFDKESEQINEEIETSKEQKIKKLQNKMAAAVKIEDYETAAQIKKQIEKVNNDS